jgi:hypothetical protein
MAIRKHVRWNGQYNDGFVDKGTEINDDSLPVATEALMFLNAVWKLPVAYFLTDGLSADVKANIVLDAIERRRNGGTLDSYQWFFTQGILRGNLHCSVTYGCWFLQTLGY